jgi:hypothetical protein
MTFVENAETGQFLFLMLLHLFILSEFFFQTIANKVINRPSQRRAPDTRSGNPQRKNCAVQAFRISGACAAENCADLADCSGGRIRLKKRF